MDNIQEAVISAQVINEFISITLKKQILPLEKSFRYAEEFMNIFDFASITKSEIKLAMHIKRKYNYSYWDSLIIASALENNCLTLYTEDMQAGHIIEGKLKIVNPFESASSK